MHWFRRQRRSFALSASSDSSRLRAAFSGWSKAKVGCVYWGEYEMKLLAAFGRLIAKSKTHLLLQALTHARLFFILHEANRKAFKG